MHTHMRTRTRAFRDRHRRRRRAQTAREDTAANLQAAGYGSLCPGGADGHGVVPPAAAAAAARRGGDGPAAEPCYVALLMRRAGDGRWASVFKPEARGALLGAGYALAGSVGDQFSDLSGANHADAGDFKLPNPVYHLL
jgi:hypothetical protein